MQIVDLKEIYPSLYTHSVFLEVSDEIYAVFLADRRAEAARRRKMYRYKAQYSLDCGNGIENAVICRPPSPEEIFDEKQRRAQVYAAVMALPEKQSRRVYARFYLGMSATGIARAEGVHPSRSAASIRSGLKKLSACL